MFLAHDIYRKPYKNTYMNILQALTSGGLLLVLTCNVIPAVSYLVNIQKIPAIQDVLKILKVGELIVYAVLPLSLPVWKLKIIIDNKRKEKKKD